MNTTYDDALDLDTDTIWSWLRELALAPPRAAQAWSLDGDRRLVRNPTPDAAYLIAFNANRWRFSRGLSSDASALLSLYVPVCTEAQIVGHLGQSLDGHIATETGDSIYVTGQENLVHLHRMRALSDAVVVGAQTVFADDPRLTTRLVTGPNPTRVILDPQRRLKRDYQVFVDGEAPTLLVCREDLTLLGPLGQADVVGVPVDRRGRFVASELRQRLAEKGLTRMFVEGGGVSVSALLEADILDRLHIAVAPLLIGSGRPGIRLPPIEQLADGQRPRYQVFQMGSDVLFDLALREPHHSDEQVDRTLTRVLPIG
ncbi:MAG: RibD family protein [Pseudomonadota bacterium]